MVLLRFGRPRSNEGIAMISLYSLVTVSTDFGPSTDPVNSDGLKTMCPMEGTFSAAASKAERDDHVIDRANIRCSDEKEARRLAKVTVHGHAIKPRQVETFHRTV